LTACRNACKLSCVAQLSTLTVRLPEDLRHRLRVYAATESKTVQEIVTKLIEEKLSGWARPKHRSRGKRA
jgi:plasmid stability protein